MDRRPSDFVAYVDIDAPSEAGAHTAKLEGAGRAPDVACVGGVLVASRATRHGGLEPCHECAEETTERRKESHKLGKGNGGKEGVRVFS